MTALENSSPAIPIALVGLGFVLLFVGLSVPYVLHNALQYTGNVTAATTIKGSQVSSPVSFYVNPGTQYNLYLVKQHDETYAVVSTVSVPIGSQIFVNSSSAQWYVTAISPPINVSLGESYDRLILANSISVVSPSLASDESYYANSSTGNLLSELSSAAPVVPFLFVLIARQFTKRWTLWSFVVVAWLYLGLVFAADELGASYGQAASITLEAALVGLPVVAYMVSRLEVSIRGRLAAKSRTG